MVSTNTTELLAAAIEILNGAGYTEGRANNVASWLNDNSALLEDPYCVVGVRVYASWQELRERWAEAQSHLIEVMSNRLPKSDAKLWDGYLVLLTPGVPTKLEERSVENIRYDTNRLRKLVITGNDLDDISEIRRFLLPLLPLEYEETPDSTSSSLDSLPDLLSSSELPRAAIEEIIRAFSAQEPILDRLHSAGYGRE